MLFVLISIVNYFLISVFHSDFIVEVEFCYLINGIKAAYLVFSNFFQMIRALMSWLVVTCFFARFLCHWLSIAVVEQEKNKAVVWIPKSSENSKWRIARVSK